MTLNIGPQHPATHGTLRIVAQLDGEQVIRAEPMAGYMHRGYEKLSEVRTYPQVTTLVNRIDWLGSFANEVPFILAAEHLMEVEAPPRAPLDPHAAVRDEPGRSHDPVPRRHGSAARSRHPGLLRLPRPGVRARPDREGHRREVPPQLRPHRWTQGRPPQGLDRIDQGLDADGAHVLRPDRGPAVGVGDLPDPHQGDRRDPQGRGHAVRPVRSECPRLGHRLGSSP